MNRREYQEVMFNSELPYPQRMLYAYLRSCVDFKTGIAGDARNKRISYQGIREALEFTRPAGSKTRPEVYSNDRIYKLLDALEKRGVVVPLEKASAVRGRRPTVRKFLPLAVGGLIRLGEESDRRATKEGDSPRQTAQGFQPFEGDCQHTEEGDTSVKSFLSLSYQYIYFDPSDDDLAWLRYMIGSDADQQLARAGIDIKVETEVFNLRRSTLSDYDMAGQKEDWRVWIVRALQHKDVI